MRGSQDSDGRRAPECVTAVSHNRRGVDLQRAPQTARFVSPPHMAGALLVVVLLAVAVQAQASSEVSDVTKTDHGDKGEENGRVAPLPEKRGIRGGVPMRRDDYWSKRQRLMRSQSAYLALMLPPHVYMRNWQETTSSRHGRDIPPSNMADGLPSQPSMDK